MEKAIVCCVAVSMMAFLIPASDAAVIFDLRDEVFNYGGGTLEDLDGGTGLSLTKGGVTANLTAIVTSPSTTVFNQTGGGFGLNSDDDTTGTSDATSQLDGDEGAESISISFTTAVFFDSVSVSSFGSGDAGSIAFTGPVASPVAIDSTGSTDAGSVQIDPGDSVTIAYVSGNGFSFDSFTVTIVPEPASLALLALGGMLVTGRCRHNRG
ncbi:MAG: PEP-CTERM sorting domain-containing protein [Planctomycetota bacterium]